MLLRSLALAAVLLALSSSPARAGSGDGAWYGYQVLATDALSWTLIVGGAKANVIEVSALGVGGLFFGGPIVHVGHGSYGRAGASFGLRVGLPLLGLGIGAAADRDSHSFIPAGPIIGVFLGSIAASIVDIAVIAREADPQAAPRILSFGGRF
jgi:hypothetical protein